MHPRDSSAHLHRALAQRQSPRSSTPQLTASNSNHNPRRRAQGEGYTTSILLCVPLPASNLHSRLLYPRQPLHRQPKPKPNQLKQATKLHTPPSAPYTQPPRVHSTALRCAADEHPSTHPSQGRQGRPLSGRDDQPCDCPFGAGVGRECMPRCRGVYVGR